MKYGDTSWIETQAVKRRQPIPKFVADRPDLPECLLFFWQSFLDLSTERSIGMGPGPIPWSRIVNYANYYDIDDAESFIQIITEVDKAYLEAESKGNKNQETKTPSR
jgi:hypothetical protein